MPDAFLSIIFRKNLRFVYNRANVHALNTLHCVYFVREIGEDETNVKAILAYLNSQPAFKLAEKNVTSIWRWHVQAGAKRYGENSLH